MEKTNLENLNKLAKLFGTDRLISPEEVQEIRGVLVGVLANNKKELESLTAETRELVNKVLNKVLDEHDTYLEKTKQIAQEAKSDTTEAIQATMKSLEEVKKLCKEVMECKPENGKDADEEYVIGEVLNRIKLPEYKEVVLDDGGAIVDKINSLPVNEENQIDAKHIKNLPEAKGGRVISGGVTRKIVEQMIEAAGGGSGSPGGSTTQLQYNNAGAFGGISGATTDGTAVTYTAGNLIAADITASGSGGLLLQSNNGTDALLIGAGGGAGATFYGGVNIAGELTVDTNTLYVDATNNVVGIGTTSPLTQTGNKLQVGDNSAANQYLVFQTSNGHDRGIHYYLSDGTTLRGYMKWDLNEDLLLKGDVTFISTQNLTNPFTFTDSGGAGIGLMGIGTTSPTHSLTLNSTATGIALYNTSDQTTNYERVQMYWTGNVYTIQTQKGGSGSNRNLTIGTVSRVLQFLESPTGTQGFYTFSNSTGGSLNALSILTTRSNSASVAAELTIQPTYNQSGTAGYTALLINPTETTTGSGTKNLLQLQAGGTDRFRVDNIGNTILSSAATSGFQVFNTSDETTNYDKFQAKWSSNVFYLSNTAGGTGSARAIRLGTVAAAGTDLPVNYLEVSHSSSGGIFKLISGSFGGSDFLKTTTTVTSSSTVQNIFNIDFTANQSSTGGYIGLLINATETATGSGSKLLADFQVGGSSKASISNAGLVTAPQIINTPATVTVTTNAGTVTRANRINNFTNSSAAAMTITMSTTSAADGDIVMVRIKDFSAVAQTITWVNTENSTVTAPTTSNGSTTLPLTVGFQYNSATSKWRCVASA